MLIALRHAGINTKIRRLLLCVVLLCVLRLSMGVINWVDFPNITCPCNLENVVFREHFAKLMTQVFMVKRIINF